MNSVKEEAPNNYGETERLVVDEELPTGPGVGSAKPRSLAANYLGRRLPWGTPWPYAIALASANTVRQLIQPDDLSTETELAIFVLMAGAVVGLVTFVHVVLWPSPRSTSSETRPTSVTPPVQEAILQPKAESQVRREEPADKWAPWWWYVGVILGVNYVRQAIMPVGTVPEWAVVLIVVAISAVLFTAITYVYRNTRD